MGVGYGLHESLREAERVLAYVLRHSLCLEDIHPGNPPPGAYVPQQPTWSHRVLQDVYFSDDHQHFALGGWGLALLMGACTAGCATACGLAHYKCK